MSRYGTFWWALGGCRIVGVSTAWAGEGVFDRAPVILGANEPGKYLKVRRYGDDGVAEGALLDAEQWAALQCCGGSTALPYPVPAVCGAWLWLFRPGFAGDVESIVARLRREKRLIVAPWEPIEGEAILACLVRDTDSVEFRDQLAMRAVHRALRAYQEGRCADLLLAAETAFAVEPYMTPVCVAWVSHAHRMNGRDVAADGFVEMAENSRGRTFAEDVRRIVRMISERGPHAEAA